MNELVALFCVLGHWYPQSMNIKIPKNAMAVINALENEGFEAFIVGGCVRDALMGRVPNDWDICTNALPEQTKAACKEAGFATFDTGIKHGTISVHADHEAFEVTTYRADGSYSDGRHPDAVTFLPDIEGDLLRRDFTVNAMAYHPERGLVDVSGGRADLATRLLRSVGDPLTRFQEDGLRVIRALRFSSVLGFDIESQTALAIHEHKELLAPVAMERISAEFLKLICGASALKILLDYKDVVASVIPQVEPMFGLDQRNPYHVYDVWEHCVRSCAFIEPDPTLRLAALIHDIGKPSCFFTDEDGRGHFYGHPDAGEPIAREVCKHLRLPCAMTDEVCLLVKLHDRPLPVTERSMRRRLAKVGEAFQRRLFKLVEADMVTHSDLNKKENLEDLDRAKALMEQALEKMNVFSERDLAINGRDLIELGYERGPILGLVKKELFSKVVDLELPNERAALASYAQARLASLSRERQDKEPLA